MCGVLLSESCGGFGVQESEPASCALRPPSAVAIAAGLGWLVQAASGVVAVLLTTTLTEPPAAIEPRPQLNALLTMEQLPCDGVAVVQSRPPLPGSASFSWTLFAGRPVPGLLTVMLKV